MAKWPYNTAEWKRLCSAVLAAYPTCQACGYRRTTDVDHRVSIKRGGPVFDPANLVAQCHACHSRKTARYDGGFGRGPLPPRGCTDDGTPNVPRHPWRSGER